MRKVAIVGSEEATRGMAPWDDLEYEIWVLNEAPQAAWCKRWDVCFQMHLERVYTGYNHVRSDHWDWLQMDHGPDKRIYMQEMDNRVPNCRVYPLEAVMGMTPDRMLTSTVAQALALAILMGYEDIGVWGVSLVSNSEYNYQLQGWIYWVGFARGVGYANGRETTLTLHSGESNFANRNYGYDGDPIMSDFFQGRVEILQGEYNTLEKRLRKIDSIIAEAMLDNKYDLAATGIRDLEKAGMECGAMAGALGEAQMYAARDGTTFTPRQEIERHAAKAQQDGDELRAMMYHAGGKCEYVWNVWRQTGKMEALQQLRKFVEEKRKLAYDTGARLGIYRENMEYLQEYDERITALGGSRALEQIKSAKQIMEAVK